MNRSARKGRVRVAGASGQALVPALLFLLVGSIGLYVAFNSFQMTSAKIKLQNTADAAAYTAAVLQARDYNFAAYTNRAMVANQVTAAQVVGLKSWIDDLDSTYTRSDLDEMVDNVADHPGNWSTPKANGKKDIAPVRQALDALLPTVAVGIGSINRALSVAQANYHSAIFAAVPDAAEAIAQQNQSDTHVTTGYFANDFGTDPRNEGQLAAWKTYTSVLTPAGSTDFDHFADVVTDADTLDNFIKNRDGTRSVAPDYQQLDDTANRICGAGSRFTINVTHDGGTQLRNDKTGWQAIDASTAHVLISCIGQMDPEAGMGASANGNVVSFMTHPPFVADEDWEGYGGYFNFGYQGSPVPKSGVPESMARQFLKGPGDPLDPANGGLMPYQDINAAPIVNTAPRITIEVERRDNTLVKTKGLHGGGDMYVRDNAAGGVMRTLSSANAYFTRPTSEASLSNAISGALRHANEWARDDGKDEYPSLFSPYWQAALAPVSIEERNAAEAMQISIDTKASKP
jgi:hypothetical protein